jgi:predicted O-methyltransferase YrrM
MVMKSLFSVKSVRSKKIIPLGQIQLSSQFGQFLRIASADSQVDSILEIGTWNGMGSTLCIEAGLRERKTPPRFVASLEANKVMHQTALKNLGQNRAVSLIHGTLVEVAALDTHDLSAEESQWILGDIDSIGSAPLVLDIIPDQIDLLVLDGGEFSSRAEFDILSSRLTRWLFLDDIIVRKNRAVRDWVVNAPETRFETVFESENRNGWGVYKICDRGNTTSGSL